MKRLIASVLVVIMLFTAVPNFQTAHAAGCVPFFNPITNVDWSMFIREFRFLGICICTTPVPRVGFKIRYAEPIALIETTQKPFFFPSFNLNLGIFSGLYKVGSQVDDSGSTIQSHYLWYPVMWVLNILSSVLCLQVDPTSIDIGYMSELDPYHEFDELNHLVQPEKLLFANPVAQAACIADCVASSFNRPLNPLYWCAGCWGSIFPDSGNVQEQKRNDVVGSHLVSTRMIDKLHNAFMLWATSPGEIIAGEGVPDSICNPVPFPRIIKSQYWLQPACPIVRYGLPIGVIPLLSEFFAKAPGFEDYVHVLWRKRECCLL
ncbi:MAG: TraU family protein [Geovibrio sp.]|nr:TraU family protein [Geovibrio sp.]